MNTTLGLCQLSEMGLVATPYPLERTFQYENFRSPLNLDSDIQWTFKKNKCIFLEQNTATRKKLERLRRMHDITKFSQDYSVSKRYLTLKSGALFLCF